MTTVFRIVATLVRAWAIVLLSAHALTSVATAVVQRGSAASGSVGAAGAITRTQNVSAQTTSVAFSAPTTGDLIIVFAHRDGSTTPPTKVAGYTTIDNTTGANSNSAILAFKFSDGTETGSGTWANATSVAVLIYRNAGLGGWAKTRSAGSSVTTSYGTLTMATAAGTSWVAGFGGHTTATDVGGTAPTGMTMRTATADVAAFDTGAGVASWSAQTATVNANSGWTTYTLEILAIPTGQLLYTFIQNSTVIEAPSGATAAVTLTQSVGTEPHILVVATAYSGLPVEVKTIDKGGTLLSALGTYGGLGTGGWGGSYGYVIGTNSATSPITVTYEAEAAGATIGIFEIAYSGVGTPSLDVDNRQYAASGGSPTGPAFTMSGGRDVVIHTAWGFHSMTAVSAPYNTPTGYSSFQSGYGFAAAFNQSSVTTPTWTTTTGVSGLTGIAFGLSPTAITTQKFTDFEASTDGTTATEALLQASSKGWGSGLWSTLGTGAAMKFASAASKPLLTAITRLNDGSSVSAAAGSLGIQFLTSTVLSYCQIDFAAGSGSAQTATSFSAGIWFKSDLPAVDLSNMDVFSLTCPGGSGFANAKFLQSPGGMSRCFQLEVVGGGGNSQINIASSTWYWLTLQYNKTGSNILKIYDASGSLVGTITEAHSGTGMPSYLVFGQTSGNTPTTGYVCNFDSLKIDPAGSYPLLP